MSRTFTSLRYKNYRLWFGANIIASTGMWMQRIAQDWVVLTVLTSGSGTALGITTALQFLPILFFSAWAGVVVDRVDRHRMLQFTQSMNGVLSLILGLLVLTNVAQLWHMYALALISGILATFDSPARQTFVSELVPGEHLPNAVGLNSAAFNLARLLGPALSGLVIEWVGPGWVFVVNVLLFLAPVIAVALMDKAQFQESKHVARGRGQIREGVRYVIHRSDIIIIMIVAGTVSAFGMNFQITSAVMATEIYGKGAGEYGILGSFMAIGSLTGALLAARRRFPRVRLVIMSAFLFGVVEVLLGLAPTYELFAILSIPTGLAMLTMITSANAAIQISTDPAMRGRVMALYMMVFMGSTPIGAPVIGWVADTWGGPWALAVGGIAAIVVSVCAAFWAIRHWDVEIEAHWGRRPITTYGPRERARDLAFQQAEAQPSTDESDTIAARHEESDAVSDEDEELAARRNAESESDTAVMDDMDQSVAGRSAEDRAGEASVGGSEARGSGSSGSEVRGVETGDPVDGDHGTREVSVSDSGASDPAADDAVGDDAVREPDADEADMDGPGSSDPESSR